MELTDTVTVNGTLLYKKAFLIVERDDQRFVMFLVTLMPYCL
jgi:hypothetical protein